MSKNKYSNKKFLSPKVVKRYVRKMNRLNQSVIICDPSPKSTWKRTPLRSKKLAKSLKKTYYESPLKHIQLSAKRWELLRAQERLVRNAKRLEKKKSHVFSPDLNTSVNDSVIILSDNENETHSERDKVPCRDTARKKKNSRFSNSKDSDRVTPRSLRTLSSRVQQSSRRLRSTTKLSNVNKNKVGTCKSGKRKRSIVESQDNTSLCLLTSDSEDLESNESTIDTDRENIAPISDTANQESDDIVVVWSSSKASTGSNKHQTKSHPRQDETVDQENNEKLFMIDYNPNSLNLSYLEDNDEPAVKKKKTSSKIDDDPSLPFSRPGLKLPDPVDLSGTIITEKLKSIINMSTNLQQQSAAANSSTGAFTTANGSTSDTQSSSVKLRDIIIDGNSIAMAHSNGKAFSEMGLKIVIDYFKQRGHSVKVFVPQYRRALCHPLIEKLYTEGTVVFTPSRNIAGRRITPYDDRFILQYATVCKGIVISLDQYRDLYTEKPEWRNTIANRLLAPTFVGDYVMFPEDPLGRNGPTLDQFLRHPNETCQS